MIGNLITVLQYLQKILKSLEIFGANMLAAAM